MSDRQYDANRFKRLVHFICDQCDVEELGSTKLNKVLWFSDTQAFARLGQSITGATYVKQKFGPVARALLPTVSQLEDEGALVERKTKRYGRPKTDYISIRDPDLSGFTADEVALVSEVMRWICDDHTAASISALSHDHVWEMAAIGEELPMHTVFSNPGDVTQEDIDWARAVMSNRQAALGT